MNKKNIGFVSYWGFGRGQSYVTLSYTRMIKNTHNVFVLKQGTNDIDNDFKYDDIHVTEYPEYHIKEDDFIKWITDNKLDAVIFNEYMQWEQEFNPLLDVCRQYKVKCFYYMVLEQLRDKDLYADYDRLIAPTKTFMNHLRKHKLRKFSYLPYSVDLTEYPVSYPPREPFIFYHPGGWGGVHSRKNTDVVIEAFKMLRDELKKDNSDFKVKLVITSQKNELETDPDDDIEVVCKNMPKEELNTYYQNCHVVLLPSKWESLGIPFIEALASGKPVIGPDCDPMNEMVVANVNGLVCSVTKEYYPDICLPGNLISATELKNKMYLILNNELYSILSKNARIDAEQRFDLTKNQKYWAEFIDKYV